VIDLLLIPLTAMNESFSCSRYFDSFEYEYKISLTSVSSMSPFSYWIELSYNDTFCASEAAFMPFFYSNS